MQDQWTIPSNFKTAAGKPATFSLNDHEKPISGIFSDDVFHSRCLDYDHNRLASWHGLNVDSSLSPMGAPASRPGSFSRIVTRMKNLITRRHIIDVTTHADRRPRLAAVAATPSSAIGAVARNIHTNQMSS